MTGSPSPGPAPGGPPATAPPGSGTKAAYVAAANALCGASADTVAGLAPPRTVGELASYLAAAVRESRALAGRLAALAPPPGDRPVVNGLAARERGLVALVDAARAAAAAGDRAGAERRLNEVRTDSVAYNRAAAGYGLTSCGNGA